MTIILDPVTILNLIFCIIIVCLGYWEYRKKQSLIALYIAITFGLFGIAHLAIILGVKSSNLFILTVRSVAYLVIIYALYKTALGHWNKE
jgi:CHASE2 domain-containing sensor protein